jgi:UDP-glucose 4-epimerase
MDGVDAVLHTAALHKPHVLTHSRQNFVDANITGTLNLLEKATSVGVGSFAFMSTTSAFGGALTLRRHRVGEKGTFRNLGSNWQRDVLP